MKPKKVFQIWYETNIGPTFSTRNKAVAFIAKEKKMTIKAVREGLKTYWNGYGYPDIQEITLDDVGFYCYR